MSVQARVNELARKHAVLEKKITAEVRRPAFDSLRVQSLKRRKFIIKQAMTAFKNRFKKD